MKTFDQIREELNNQLYEKAPSSTVVDRLAYGHNLRGHGDQHNGHEGASIEHSNHADEHKGTAAGKFHAKAAVHHDNAMVALKKGNMTSSLKHAALAKDAASKAKQAGGEASPSHQIHTDHDREKRLHKPMHSIRKDAENKKAARANPAKAAVGKTVSKVKKMFGRK